MAIFRFNNNNFEKVEQTKFSSEGILERQHIQNALKKQIEIISPNLLVISEEFCEWEDSRRRIDLLAIDRDANIVVIELKRTETGEHMELQALRYASMVSTLTFKRAVEIFEKYLKSIESDLNPQEEILSFLGWSEEESKDEFANDVKIILVSSDFSKELTTSVMWLNERKIDIKCFRLIPYKMESEVLIDVQQIIPLPEAESYQIKIREQKEEKREARTGMRDYSRYSFNGENGLSKRGIVLSVWKQYLEDNQNLTISKLQNDFPKDIKGNLFVLKQQALEQQERDSNNLTRYFLENEAVAIIENNEYVISNQWGKGNIEKFIDYAKKLGYEIGEE